MKFSFFKTLLHLILVLFLTVLTQVGGIIYLISILFIQKNKSKYKLKRLLLFSILYLTSTFFIIPKITPYFGRVQIEDNQYIQSHNFFTKICNRNYVTLKMKAVLDDTSVELQKQYPEISLIYLDANFPFFDGFPLLPHLSHNDGKKVDISFIYRHINGRLTNRKPSNSGYGVFENPSKKEKHQTKICKQQGFWQYDFTKYLTFGANDDLKLDIKATKRLIQILLKQKEVSKIFIELHLKTRLKLSSSKLRFHGCRSVRHDDHIHFQIR